MLTFMEEEIYCWILLFSLSIIRKIGLGKEDYYFWKQIGKSLLCTYALYGAAMWWQENSPLGWWNFKYIPKVKLTFISYTNAFLT